jgi:hypothetical protein
LIYHGGAQYELPVDVTGAIFKTSFSAIGRNEVISSPIFCDELSGFQYTFGFLPIEYLHHCTLGYAECGRELLGCE